MSHSDLRQSGALAAGLTMLLVLALSATQPVEPAVGRSDGSGGRAVPHRAGGAKLDSPALAARAPDAALFRPGMNASEPTLGVTHDGQIFYTAFQSNTRIETLRSADQGKTWDVVSPKIGSRNAQLLSFDPYIYVDNLPDKDNSRVFTIDLTVACSYLSFSDDRGKTWTTNPLACGRPVNDHQTLFAGPPAVSTTVGHPHVVYYCWNDVATSSCSKSLDGGITWVDTGSPAYPGLDPDAEDPGVDPNGPGGDPDVQGQCGGLHGHGYVGADGTVYIPKGHCGQPWLSFSKNEGLTWTRVQVAKNGVAHHEAGVAADKKGNIYYTWVARDRLPYLAISRDEGKTWTKPMMVGAPGVKESNLPGIDAGAPGKVALVYMGSENSPGPPFPEAPECTAIQSCPAPEGYEKVTWNGYMTITTNALAKDPVFYSTTVNDKRDPLIRQNCGPGRCRAAYDFIDIVIAPNGEVWAAFVDGCILVCPTTPPNNAGQDAVVGHLVGGPRLR